MIAANLCSASSKTFKDNELPPPTLFRPTIRGTDTCCFQIFNSNKTPNDQSHYNLGDEPCEVMPSGASEDSSQEIHDHPCERMGSECISTDKQGNRIFGFKITKGEPKPDRQLRREYRLRHNLAVGLEMEMERSRSLAKA
eukprot:CAMPEP_0113712728 /NCGR_PEP_ID=MMETSP0038_2-20120614/31556_1 /TAXON_ID=2898 /ORGANISM="Cryptomonas paramecium" /LENGTH=139 /DNA_ID=CAMNT_0000639293 /DNA_START=41 /DNA_END=457 /DNA_ORIENTATION=- /assembly_acc=CAM_ASM_000170